MDGNAERQQVAATLGAIPVPAGSEAVSYLKSVTGGRGVDCALEAVGAPGALRCAFDAVRMGGGLPILMTFVRSLLLAYLGIVWVEGGLPCY